MEYSRRQVLFAASSFAVVSAVPQVARAALSGLEQKQVHGRSKIEVGSGIDHSEKELMHGGGDECKEESGFDKIRHESVHSDQMHCISNTVHQYIYAHLITNYLEGNGYEDSACVTYNK